jgi:mRNA interferase MazF
VKEFDPWNEEKKHLENQRELYFREGEVWWFSVGVNVGIEIDGKGEKYRRPGLIIKKFNKHSFLILPLSKIPREDKYILPVGLIGRYQGYANISQIKTASSKRLWKRIQFINSTSLKEIKKIVRDLLFPDDSLNCPSR